MIRKILMMPSRCLDKLADYCFSREERADYHHIDPLISKDDWFAIPEMILTYLAHPIQAYKEIRQLIHHKT